MTFAELDAFEVASILVTLAALLGYANFRLFQMPQTIGLLVMGAVASLVLVGLDLVWPGLGLSTAVRGFLEQVDLPTALMEGMLCFLLFAGALHVDLENLLKSRWLVLIIATLGMVISTVLVGAGFWALGLALGLPVPLAWCLVFGALISPTDPVAVMGVLKYAGIGGTLEAKIAGESLFNDGVAVVLFAILLAAALSGHDFSALSAIRLFAVEAGGGMLLGLVTGWIAYRLMASIDEHNLEVLITLALVMGGYVLAHRLHVAGPVAMATAGLLIGNHGTRFAMSPRTREHVTIFWSLIDEILNAVLFLLLGMEVLAIALHWGYLAMGVLAWLLVLAARAVAVGLPILALKPFARFAQGAFSILVWGGLRGGISVALALSLPAGPAKAELLTVTYVIVLMSILIQGLTIGPLARRLVKG